MIVECLMRTFFKKGKAFNYKKFQVLFCYDLSSNFSILHLLTNYLCVVYIIKIKI